MSDIGKPERVINIPVPEKIDVPEEQPQHEQPEHAPAAVPAPRREPAPA